MPKFFIEVPHEEDAVSCTRAVEIFLKTGSHYLTHADWGCRDGIHKAWITVDVDNREQARAVLPPAYRRDANIVKLNKFTMQEMEELLHYHNA